MQFIEHNALGVNSIVLTLEKPGSGIRFVLFPMIHIASPEFYREVRRRLEDCDVVVAEGVRGRRSWVIALSYRIAGRLRRDDLIDQGRGLDLAGLQAEIMRPDLSATEFARGWRGMARWMRWLLLAGAPVIGLWLVVVGPRRFLLRHDMTTGDLLSPIEEEMSEIMPEVYEVMVAGRDRALCQALAQLATQAPGVAALRTVGVCWGAEHMRAVIETLYFRLRYRIVDAVRVPVF